MITPTSRTLGPLSPTALHQDQRWNYLVCAKNGPKTKKVSICLSNDDLSKPCTCRFPQRRSASGWVRFIPFAIANTVSEAERPLLSVLRTVDIPWIFWLERLRMPNNAGSSSRAAPRPVARAAEMARMRNPRGF